jgi:hypothetical protein
MPVKRFSWILRNIHASAVMPGKGYHNFYILFRIRPVTDSLLKAFRENYEPTREKAIV